jgi:pectin methylesterase-like acyl-CoA thioesterase
VRLPLRLAVVATALVLVAGCESAGEKAKEKDQAALKSSASRAVCAKDAKAVSLPTGFPAAFPLPSGMVVTSAEDRGTSGLVVQGVASTAFKDVLKALQTDLPAKGFTPKNGETEPHDAESDWSSADYDGRWAIRELTQCGSQTLVSVVARKK